MITLRITGGYTLHVIIDSLRFCQREKGPVIHAWCLMPSHLHMIVSTQGELLSDIMRDFKKFTSKELIRTIKNVGESRRGWMLGLFSEVADHLKRVSGYKVWQDGTHPLVLTSAAAARRTLNYIHNNPVADDTVDEPEEYKYSSARDYCSKKKGYLEVELLD